MFIPGACVSGLCASAICMPGMGAPGGACAIAHAESIARPIVRITLVLGIPNGFGRGQSATASGELAASRRFFFTWNLCAFRNCSRLDRACGQARGKGSVSDEAMRGGRNSRRAEEPWGDDQGEPQQPGNL